MFRIQLFTAHVKQYWQSNILHNYCY